MESAGDRSISDIPRFGLFELQAAIDDVIYWQQHHPVTREDRMARDLAYVRLQQARWFVNNAIHEKGLAA